MVLPNYLSFTKSLYVYFNYVLALLGFHLTFHKIFKTNTLLFENERIDLQ